MVGSAPKQALNHCLKPVQGLAATDRWDRRARRGRAPVGAGLRDGNLRGITAIGSMKVDL